MSYFTRRGSAFVATEHVGGAWNVAEQHIAPALGLLVHAVEADRDARRDDRLPIGRLSFDILGTVAVDAVDIGTRVLRAGRTIELIEATLAHAGRSVVLLRAWLEQRADTRSIQATRLPAIEPPDTMEPWDPTTVWPGGFIASVEVRRRYVRPGRASYWVRTEHALIEDQPVSALAGAAMLFDIANGMTLLVDPRDVAFPNLDLTAHLFRDPQAGWLGFDTMVSIGPDGRGLTHSIVHDRDGAFGTVSQSLTVRPARPPAG